MKKRHFLIIIPLAMGVLCFLGGCSYTAPFRQMQSLPADRKVVVTLTEVEHRPGQKGAFFRDTKNVIADLPNQSGLVGYSFRFQILGRKAWTMTAWGDEASRDAFVESPVHLRAMRNSRITAQNMRFTTVNVLAGSLPMHWEEALRLLKAAPAYD